MKIINKIITTVVVIMLMLFNSMAFAVEVTNGTVNTETLRLRKEPSTDSIVLELLSKDDKLEILEEKDEWYKVKFKDYTGYVSKEFISKNGEVKSSEEKNNKENTTKNTDENTATEGTVDVKDKNAVTNVEVKVYILPLINSNVVTSLEQKTSVEIVNVAGGWAYVNVNNVSGWIRLDKLSISESSNNSNVSNSETDNSQTDTNKVEKNTTQTTKQTEFTARNAYVSASSVNVRSSASTTSQVVTTLLQNEQIKLVGEENGWYKVEVNNKNGYILKTLVSDTKVQVTSRSAVPTRETTENTNKNTSTNINTNTTNNTTKTATTTNTTVATSTNAAATTSSAQTTNQTNTTNSSETKVEAQQSSTNTTSQTSSSKGEQVVAYAKNYLGCKYVYGGSGPSVFDCSGFTMYVYKHFGYSMGHSAVTQAYLGTYVPRSNLQPGDLIIFNNQANTSIGHVGMYVGGGNFIHASSGSGKIIISPLSNAYYNTRYVTARRIFN